MSSNPKIKKCRCGNTFEPRIWHKIVMLVKGYYIWTCNNCQNQYKFVLINHVVKVETVNVDKKELWKHG